MVPLVAPWHDHHRRAFAALQERVDRGETMVIAAATLIETYSVLTRWPKPFRVSPAEAIELIDRSFLDRGELVALEAREYLALLQRLGHEGVAGGLAYDAVVAACALQAGVGTLVTFNERHFRRLLGRDLRIGVP